MNLHIKKLLSIVISFALLAGVISVSGISFADEINADLSGAEAFACALTELISDAENVAVPDETSDGEIGTRSISDSFSSKRLIVKSDAAIDDFGAIDKVEGFLGLHIFQYASVNAAVNAYYSYLESNKVEWVEVDAEVETASVEPTVDIPGITADGSKFLSWGADYLGVEAYQEYLSTIKGLSTVTVGVVDTGIDTDHELFGGYYDPATNPDGRILKSGRNFSESGEATIPEDDNGHGTHVSGTIVDLTLDNVKILPVKVLDNYGYGYNSSVCMGMLYAVSGGADIISMSLGGSIDSDSYIEEYVVDIADEMGVPVIVAAGNESSDTRETSPGFIDKCIVVASVDSDLTQSWFSNMGVGIDVSAPGNNILSACMGGGYIAFSGTSMATPHVSALAALYLSDGRDCTVSQITDLICKNASKIGLSGDSYYYGAGLVYAKTPSIDRLPNIKVTYSEDNYGGDYFEEPVSVTLECDGAESIYYTVDGRSPIVTNATLYNGAFTVSRSSVVRAVAFSNKAVSIPLSKRITIEETEPVYTLVRDGGKLTASYGYLPMNLEIPSGVTEIGDYAFCGKMIETVKFSDSVKSIGDGAFMITELNDEISLGNVTALGNQAFYDCSSLYSVDGAKVKAIGNFCFSSSDLSNGVNFPYAESIGDNAFSNIYIQKVYLPKVKSVGSYAFFNDFALESADVSATQSIGDYAFVGTNLSGVKLPKATKVGKFAFSQSTLEYAEIPVLEEIGDYAFFSCGMLEKVKAPALKTVGYAAFAGNESLANLDLPAAVSIGDYAFDSSYLSDGVNFPNVVKIGEGAFNWSMLAEISLPKATDIGEGAFFYAELTYIDAPLAENIGDYAFALNSMLEGVALPKAKTVGNRAFMGCDSLSNVYLPVVQSIGAQAFASTSLKGIELNRSVTSIGADIFSSTFSVDDDSIIIIIESEFDEFEDIDMGDGMWSEFTIIGELGSYAEKYAEEYGYGFAKIGSIFTVTFVNNTGKVISEQEVEVGKAADEPNAPFKFGYIFDGWDGDTSFITADTEFAPMYTGVFSYISMRITNFFYSIEMFFVNLILRNVVY